MANYRISELDFDDIKFNLKQFLSNYRDNQGNLVFKDYDFEASSLSILLDLLAYNTHYNAYLANMVANEMFLDSAIKRESVVSIAKHLGYTPLSSRSARAKVTFTIQNPAGSPAVLTLPKFTKFSTTINGTSYTFATLDSITTKPVNNQYTFSDVEIVEGEALVYTYRVDKSGPDEKYAIPNTNIDTTTIRVIVQNSYTDLTQTTFTKADSLEGLTGESNVFFLEENPTGKYEVYFGDGVLGKKLVSGNLVRIEYLKGNGSLCNVSDNISQSFVLEDLVGGVTLDSAIIATQNSTGGDEADSIEEIKFRAPRFLSSFNRAVTANDYKAIIEANYPLVESVSVWGGEENVPPVYGKVYISLKPYSGFAISTELKNRIKTEILAEKKMLAIIPEILDPNYLYIGIDSKLKFDPKNSRYLASEIEILTKAAIEGYFVNELQKFNKSFIYSKLSRAIDAVDSSIVGNVSGIKLQKRIYPTIDSSNKYSGTTEIKFVNSLISGTVQSTGFVFNSNDVLTPVYIKDVLTSSSTGTLNLYNLFTDALIKSNLGTVNYTTGAVNIPDLNPAGFYTTENVIKIYGKTNELDIQSSRDVVLVIDDSTLNTTIKQSAGLTVDITLV